MATWGKIVAEVLLKIRPELDAFHYIFLCQLPWDDAVDGLQYARTQHAQDVLPYVWRRPDEPTSFSPEHKEFR